MGNSGMENKDVEKEANEENQLKEMLRSVFTANKEFGEYMIMEIREKIDEGGVSSLLKQSYGYREEIYRILIEGASIYRFCEWQSAEKKSQIIAIIKALEREVYEGQAVEDEGRGINDTGRGNEAEGESVLKYCVDAIKAVFEELSKVNENSKEQKIKDKKYTEVTEGESDEESEEEVGADAGIEYLDEIIETVMKNIENKTAENIRKSKRIIRAIGESSESYCNIITDIVMNVALEKLEHKAASGKTEGLEGPEESVDRSIMEIVLIELVIELLEMNNYGSVVEPYAERVRVILDTSNYSDVSINQSNDGEEKVQTVLKGVAALIILKDRINEHSDESIYENEQFWGVKTFKDILKSKIYIHNHTNNNRDVSELQNTSAELLVRLLCQSKRLAKLVQNQIIGAIINEIENEVGENSANILQLIEKITLVLLTTIFISIHKLSTSPSSATSKNQPNNTYPGMLKQLKVILWQILNGYTCCIKSQISKLKYDKKLLGIVSSFQNIVSSLFTYEGDSQINAELDLSPTSVSDTLLIPLVEEMVTSNFVNVSEDKQELSAQNPLFVYEEIVYAITDIIAFVFYKAGEQQVQHQKSILQKYKNILASNQSVLDTESSNEKSDTTDLIKNITILAVMSGITEGINPKVSSAELLSLYETVAPNHGSHSLGDILELESNCSPNSAGYSYIKFVSLLIQVIVSNSIESSNRSDSDMQDSTKILKSLLCKSLSTVVNKYCCNTSQINSHQDGNIDTYDYTKQTYEIVLTILDSSDIQKEVALPVALCIARAFVIAGKNEYGYKLLDYIINTTKSHLSAMSEPLHKQEYMLESLLLDSESKRQQTSTLPPSGYYYNIHPLYKQRLLHYLTSLVVPIQDSKLFGLPETWLVSELINLCSSNQLSSSILLSCKSKLVLVLPAVLIYYKNHISQSSFSQPIAKSTSGWIDDNTAANSINLLTSLLHFNCFDKSALPPILSVIESNSPNVQLRLSALSYLLELSNHSYIVSTLASTSIPLTIQNALAIAITDHKRCVRKLAIYCRFRFNSLFYF
ncbi:hypothetical protein AX774_g605 [Zancudomyces culisetae]|uniref:MMS19 nucleotide excision repair protein n=1 Tax=Zancudomyces culisetae TaxID=1213189 RepID=A0A1R1PY15_ZANCU|nr:hypothetical protein AX774_g605 [Zancudomyces culisetae]|eukprot:OMH85829.1 hypothetical protein AX774_g605 [Zancudomyces culisetae]